MYVDVDAPQPLSDLSDPEGENPTFCSPGAAMVDALWFCADVTDGVVVVGVELVVEAT